MRLRLANVFAMISMLGCAARTSPMPQVPVKQEYSIERNSRAALKAFHELQPDLDAVRLLHVRVQHGYRAAALFYSDGTLQVDVYERASTSDGPRKHTRYPSARLTAAELARLNQDMSVLSRCRIETEEAQRRSISYGGHGPWAEFEILTQPRHEIVSVSREIGDCTPECLAYEKFVVDLITQTVDYEYDRR